MESELSAFSVVLRGAFNPAIFTPHWLAKHAIISDAEAERARVHVVAQELAAISLDRYELVVEREKFVISRVGPVAITLFDTALKLFGEILVHTPLTMAGLNWEDHYRVRDYQTLNTLGDLLAPKGPWGQWGRELMDSAENSVRGKSTPPGGRVGGMRRLVMEQSFRPDGAKGHVQFTVEPSTTVKPGLHLKMNDHFEIEDIQKSTGALDLIKIITDKFGAGERRKKLITEELLKNVT